MRLRRSSAVAASVAAALLGIGPGVALGAAGRSFELVSPPDKGGVAVGERVTVQSAPSGDAVAFGAPGAFGGAATSLTYTYYVARRSSDGWSTVAVDPPQRNTSSAIFSSTQFFSQDLAQAMQVSQAALTPGAFDNGSNVYRWDASGQRTLVASSSDGALASDINFISQLPTFGATPDLSRFAFESRSPLLPGVTPGTTNVYEVVGNDLQLVDKQADGSPMPGGAGLTTFLLAQGATFMSADGGQVFFNSPVGIFNSATPLYMRRDDGTIVPVSVSRRAGDPDDPVPAYFVGVGDDGRVAYFTAGAPLTDDAVGGSLYRYDTASGDLTDLTVPIDSGGFSGEPAINGMARDGSTIYFNSQYAYAPGAVDNAGTANLYVADEAGVRLVTPDIGTSGVASKVSDSGRYIAFTTQVGIDGFDNRGSACAAPGAPAPDGPCTEVYVYDKESGSLQCATCAPLDGQNGDSTLGYQYESVSNYVGRAVLDDGTVFFSTTERLAPEDSNGVNDVYSWKDGKATLISSGDGSSGAMFEDATPDGSNVFFTTANRLVASDTDKVPDLYDARVGGGIAAQNQLVTSQVCAGEGCQGPTAASPQLGTAGSETFSGDGNLDEAAPRAPAARKPRSRLNVGKPVVGRRGTVRVPVVVSGRGRLTVSGKQVSGTTKSVRKGGKHTIVVRLTSRARRKLRRRHTLDVALNVVYAPTGAKRTSRRVVARVKQPAPRRGHQRSRQRTSNDLATTAKG
jgi:hypothetical protein